MVDLDFDLDFDFSLLERSLLVSLAPFRFPRSLCFETFVCFDNFPMRLVDADDNSSLDFDAFIRRGKIEINSSAWPSFSRRISTFCASDLRTWSVLFCADASQQKRDAAMSKGTFNTVVFQRGRFLFLLLAVIGGMHSMVAFMWMSIR